MQVHKYSISSRRCSKGSTKDETQWNEENAMQAYFSQENPNMHSVFSCIFDGKPEHVSRNEAAKRPSKPLAPSYNFRLGFSALMDGENRWKFILLMHISALI